MSLKAICALATGLMLLSGLTACQNRTGLAEPQPSALSLPDPLVSPLTSPLNSPIATPVLVLTGPNFAVDPVKVGDTEVSGRGPANLEILIVDVTLSARELARTRTSASGEFKTVIAKPAILGRLIGIQVPMPEDVTMDQWETRNRILGEKAGPGFRFYPQLGFVFASTQVKE